METFNLKYDMKLFCVTAQTFPGGIKPAFTALENMLPTVSDRIFFGISYNTAEGIIYKAAVAEDFEGEGEIYGCETFILQGGEYLTETVLNWKNNEESIGKSFQRLLADPRLDEKFPCVEWYKSEGEVWCMVKMDPSKALLNQV